ncbi:(3S)-malyl-CoA thioesterase [Rhodothalassium salexigens DSM 2132]|uniref:(3S)-malyl-CoA thioesterase n=1 Tax=Rhodothalassium salexigens DSM 2132 TaxID=1188247 RepID=A0A4R2PPS6_RHOSA|nr:YbgC/FadM family acyl-CoA thioesterase [Rhodothalassium salexigens]MBB4210662.1 acyl-CoA thioester hydrolase [Rhodothalassium salexigens DSM 2132]MBK1637863.1 hypothetical protein [Rhodothalassium salexigens DSM 2132]TCP37782.1 (3S)-malyl-CoA thioesterase [Rhodothalassium salexigens DSM 2132]
MTEPAATALSPGVQGVLDGARHRLGLRVYFEDTDTAGIVYHARYLAFFERGRAEYLRAAGIHHGPAWVERDIDTRLGFAVTRCDMEFVRPARLDDWLEIHTEVETSRAASVVVRQCAWRGDTLLVRARIGVAVLDGHGRPRRMPADWRRVLDQMAVPAETMADDTKRDARGAAEGPHGEDKA